MYSLSKTVDISSLFLYWMQLIIKNLFLIIGVDNFSIGVVLRCSNNTLILSKLQIHDCYLEQFYWKIHLNICTSQSNKSILKKQTHADEIVFFFAKF